MSAAAGLPARVERGLEERAGEQLSVRLAPTLDRITDLLDLLGRPQRAYPAIHITGTNGKTSTARIADALLRAVGLRTGRYTSPHLQEVTERIAIDGEALTPDRFVALYDEVTPYAELVDARHEHRVSYFELLTAMGFAAFADAPVDVAVVEVGLGGRWDATNVVHAPVAVVTPIGLDHRDVLGDTVTAIAGEKAGIVHEGAVLVSAAQPAEAEPVLARRAAEVGARVLREGHEFGLLDRRVAVGGQLLTVRGLGGVYEELFLPLHGAHQADNAATALVAVEAFLAGHPPSVDALREGLAAADSPGRLELLGRSPTVLVDAAHNPAGAAALAAALGDSFRFTRLVAVVALLSDKDAPGFLRALAPVVSEVVVTVNSSPRALPVEKLAEAAADVLGAERVHSEPTLPQAVATAVALAGTAAGAGVVVTGSVVTAGEARSLLG